MSDEFKESAIREYWSGYLDWSDPHSAELRLKDLMSNPLSLSAIDWINNRIAFKKATYAALAAQQNSPSADTFEQPFKEGAGVSEDTPTSALGGLSDEEVREIINEGLKHGDTALDILTHIADAITLRSASRRGEG